MKDGEEGGGRDRVSNCLDFITAHAERHPTRFVTALFKRSLTEQWRLTAAINAELVHYLTEGNIFPHTKVT